MKKFYIPTSSLNFNNILSTESVSPKAFYECRKFGYGRWTSIPENSGVFVVTLYDHPGMFERTQSDLEDHPLLIEYSTDEEFKKVGDGIYVSDHTLYFNPAITRFIFFTEQDKNVALSLTESSLETKFVSVYGRRISVETFEKRYAPIGIHVPNKVNETEVEKDRLINRMKGLLYGYYVGASVAATPEQVRELSAYLQIQNIFAAIVSSANHMPTDAQREQLKLAFAELNRFDPLYNALLEFERDTSRVDQLFAILRKFGKDISPIDVESLITSLKSEVAGDCYGIRWVKDKVQCVQNEMNRNRIYLSPEKDEILVIDGKLDKISNECLPDKMMQKLYLAWANEVLVKPEFNGKVSSCKEGLADALTFKAKEVLGFEWVDGNLVRRYLNAMRKHIIGKNEFTEEWRNGLLSSMTAVLSKGDDWEGLLRFMQSKGLTDYRLSFAIYGELNGFANLTRDFTDVVLDGRNKDRRAMYQEFYGQLHGRQIDWSQIDKSSEVQSGVETLKTRVLRFFDGPGFKCKKSKAEKQSLRSILLSVFDQISFNPDPIVFIQALAERKDGWSDKKQPWKIMQKEFAPEYVKHGKVARKKKQRNDNNAQELLKFDVELSGAKLESGSWIQKCAAMISDQDARKLFESDMHWFLTDGVSWRTSNGVVVHDNKKLVEQLEKYLNYCSTTTHERVAWKCSIYKRMPVPEIIDYLYEHYGK